MKIKENAVAFLKDLTASVEIGAAPKNEDHAKIGEGEYHEYWYRALKECDRFKKLLLHKFGKEPDGAILEFTYSGEGQQRQVSVACRYDPNVPAAVEYAHRCQKETPETWESFVGDAFRKELVFFGTGLVDNGQVEIMAAPLIQFLYDTFGREPEGALIKIRRGAGGEGLGSHALVCCYCPEIPASVEYANLCTSMKEHLVKMLAKRHR